MQKTIITACLALCLCCILAFSYGGAEKKSAVSGKETAKRAPFVTLSKAGTFNPGSLPVIVEFDYDLTVPHGITNAKIYFNTNPCNSCNATPVGPWDIEYHSGDYYAVEPITFNCESGSVTINWKLDNFGVLCL